MVLKKKKPTKNLKIVYKNYFLKNNNNFFNMFQNKSLFEIFLTCFSYFKIFLK